MRPENDKKPVEDRNEPSSLMGNNNHFHKRSADEALKAAKLMEKQRMAKGYKYVQGPNRSMILTKE